jgi:hypothetical protein
MPFLYSIPQSVLHLVSSGQASVFGAIIKDTATGQIIAHMQPSGALGQLLGGLTGLAAPSFSPLSAVALVQNEQIKRGIADLQNGMLLVQNLQYGTLALSGLGLGISVAGFAATLAKLKAIEGRLSVLMEAVTQITRDRRDDEMKILFATVAADIENIDSLSRRQDPRPIATMLQASLTRSAMHLQTHFRREADLAGRMSMARSQIEVLWVLAAAIRVCQEAMVYALFAADELEVAEQMGASAARHQIDLLESISPDLLSRLVARSEPDPQAAIALRAGALADSRLLSDGLIGGVRTISGQASLAAALRADGISGPDYLGQSRTAPNGLLCLLPKSVQ